MSTLRMTVGFIVIAVSAFQGVSAEAGNNRSVVSTTGLDTNNCSVPAPCRSFAAALAQTNPKGEIIVLDSGGYGPATITQPVTITAPVGIRASVFTATAINGFTINTMGNVSIKGIGFLGGGNGTNGIEVDNVGTLYLDTVEVQDFTATGILFKTGRKLFVANSVVKDCTSSGLEIDTGSAYVRGSAFLNSVGNGVFLTAGSAVMVDSVASFNAGDGAEVDGGTLHLTRFASVFNDTGIDAFSGTLRFEYSLSEGNAFGFHNGGTLSGSNPGTSVLVGTSRGGTLSAAEGLQ